MTRMDIDAGGVGGGGVRARPHVRGWQAAGLWADEDVASCVTTRPSSTEEIEGGSGEDRERCHMHGFNS